MKLPNLTKEEQEEFASAGLFGLYNAMREPVEEAIAEEAVTNFDKEHMRTTIRGLQVQADKNTLARSLNLSSASTGRAWTPEQVISHLEETEEEVAKRKKGAQGVPTQSLKEKNKLFRFIAQAVCLKKDDKHLSEQAFMEAARILDNEQMDWAKMLEKTMTTQMAAIKEKGQKLYSCAPIWQCLYRKAQEESAQPPRKKTKTTSRGGSSTSSRKGAQVLKELKEARQPQQQASGEATGTSKVSTSGLTEKPEDALKKIIRDIIHKPMEVGKSKEKGQEQERIKVSPNPTEKKGKEVLVESRTQQATELKLLWAEQTKIMGPSGNLRQQLLKAPVVPFPDIPTLAPKDEALDEESRREVSLRATMIALNTLALQAGNMFRQNKEAASSTALKSENERMKTRMEELLRENDSIRKQAEELKSQAVGKKKKWQKKKRQLKKEASQAKERADEATAEVQQYKKTLSQPVLLRMVEELKAPQEEGVWINAEQLQAIMTNVQEIIS